MSANPQAASDLRPSGSKLDLIKAAVSAISNHGLSGLTSAKIASAAGHTAASINFHFGTQEALLLATLREVSEEFAEVVSTVLKETHEDPLRSVLAIVDASLSRRLSDAQKIAVWYAFLAESNARSDYQDICGERDESFNVTIATLCTTLIGDRGPWPDAKAVALGLAGLIDQQWQGILFEGDEFDREAAKRQCRAYLCSVFPWLAERIEAIAPVKAAAAVVETRVREGIDADLDSTLKYTLPAWIYNSEEFYELEKDKLFMPSWQIVCHVSEVPKAGDYVTFDYFGRRGFVSRDEHGTLRAFNNVCAHRAHAIVSGERGNCAKFFTCAYHGWTYHLDGRNRSVSAADTFPKFDRSRFGLKDLELEVFAGFVFVRLRSGEASVAQRMAPHATELAHYRIEQMVPLDDLWEHDVNIDWKNLVENYVEDYHFPMGHPGLSALMESQYDRQVFADGTMRLSHHLREKPLRNWSAERYARFLPEMQHLPPHMRRRWTYLGLFPNVYFDIYPEWLDFFQLVPLGAGRTRIRARSYGFADDRREMKAARWLCTRLNARVQAEDEILTQSVQRGLGSGSYTRGILSEKEIVLAGFQDWIRGRMPVTHLIEAPLRGTVAQRNAALERKL